MKIVWMLLALIPLGLIPRGDEPPAKRGGEEEPATEDPTTLLGRHHSWLFLKGRLHELWDAFTPEMKSAFGGKASVGAHRKVVSEEWGFQQELLSESVGELDGFRTYSRVARFKKSSPLIEMFWMFDDEDRVASYKIRPKYINAPTEHLEHVTTTDLRLPVDGEWRVLAGGRDVTTNHHAASFDQRFAIDLFVAEEEKAFAGEGKRNDDFFGFGRKVRAPAAGVVLTVVDGVEDNLPGFPNRREPLGNHVVIDHENGEYSFLAHLQKGSIVVEEEARVKAGALIGQVGNSGDSKLPHAHHHLQLTGVFLKGDGLPAQFQDYIADDEAVTRGEPVQRQRVRNMTEAERKAAAAAIGPPTSRPTESAGKGDSSSSGKQ